MHSEISRRFTVKLFTLGIRVMKEVSGPDVHAAEIKDISETFFWKNSHSGKGLCLGKVCWRQNTGNPVTHHDLTQLLVLYQP